MGEGRRDCSRIEAVTAVGAPLVPINDDQHRSRIQKPHRDCWDYTVTVCQSPHWRHPERETFIMFLVFIHNHKKKKLRHPHQDIDMCVAQCRGESLAMACDGDGKRVRRLFE